MSDKIYFIFGTQTKTVLEIAKSHPLSSILEFVSLDSFLKDPKKYTSNEKILVSASTDEIKTLMKLSIKSDCSFAISIVAREDQNYLRDSFHLSKNIEENITQALEAKVKYLDLLFCKDEIVLNLVQIGDTPPLSYLADSFEKKSLKERFASFIDIFKKFKNLHKTKLTIKTNKEQIIETVASGVVVVEHDNKTFASKIVSGMLKVNDAKLSALIISPPSIVAYLSFLFKTLFLSKKNTLPKYVGYIESSSLYIDSDEKLDVKVDAKEFAKTPIELEVKQKAIKMALPDSFWEMEGSSSEKDSIKLSTLPSSKEMIDFQKQKLPLFTHASEEQYQSLFSSLRDEAKSSSTFMTLMFLSTLLATVGLYLNSSSVIIGAMLLAPLMQPIVSFSMGVLRGDKSIYISSIKTILIGICIALVSSFLFALIMPYDLLTNEMQGRLKPTILDLIVALISGVAAAYAKNNEKISGSLVGVSIAVALVPPIAVSGIGLGWFDFDMFYHAFLLFLTNFAGIVFAASLLFLAQGFSPLHRAKKGLLFSLGVALIVSIPLYLSFKSIVEDANIKSTIANKSYIIDGVKIKIEEPKILHEDGVLIRAKIVSQKHLNSLQRSILKNKIENDLSQNIRLELVERLVI